MIWLLNDNWKLKDNRFGLNRIFGFYLRSAQLSGLKLLHWECIKCLSRDLKFLTPSKMDKFVVRSNKNRLKLPVRWVLLLNIFYAYDFFFFTNTKKLPFIFSVSHHHLPIWTLAKWIEEVLCLLTLMILATLHHPQVSRVLSVIWQIFCRNNATIIEYA